MHEYSVMSQVVKLAEEEAKRHKATKVLELTLELGELALLQKPQLEFAFEILSKDTILKGAILSFRDIKATLRCDSCDKAASLSELELEGNSAYYAHYIPLLCPECKQKMEVIGGKEFTIKEMKMDIPD